jgi:hypothetical protein
MTSPGIMQALAHERENEIRRRAARRRPVHTREAPRARRVRTLLAAVMSSPRPEHRTGIGGTDCEIGRP